MPHRIRGSKKIHVLRTARDLASSDPERAIEVLDEYLAANPRNAVDVLIIKGNILDMQERFDEAREVCERALRLHPTNVPALIDLGDHYSNIEGNFRKALSCYDRALDLLESGHYYFNKEDEYVTACREKAGALVQLNRPREAMKCLIKGLLRYPMSSILLDALQRARASYDQSKEGKGTKRKRGRVVSFRKKGGRAQ
jgi:tetratricopeptide (TPR) repeat protein